MSRTYEQIQKDINKHQYSKVGTKDGKIGIRGKLSAAGAAAMIAANPNFIYLPDIRLAGDLNDLQLYFASKGWNLNNEASKGYYNAQTITGVMKNKFDNEVKSAKNYNKTKPKSPSTSRKGRKGRKGRKSTKGRRAKSPARPRGKNDLVSRAQRDIESHRYSKVLIKDGSAKLGGKIKLSGAANIWSTNPAFLYIPSLRLAGNQRDIDSYFTSKGLDVNILNQGLRNGYYNASIVAPGQVMESNYNTELQRLDSFNKAQPKKPSRTSRKGKKGKKGKKRKAPTSPRAPRKPYVRSKVSVIDMANRDALKQQYTKIAYKDGKIGPTGKVKLTGAMRAWSSTPDIFYLKTLRLSGNQNDLTTFLSNSGFNASEIQNAFTQRYGYADVMRNVQLALEFSQEINQIKAIRV